KRVQTRTTVNWPQMSSSVVAVLRPTSRRDTEGKSVTLNCTYATTSSFPLLYWYRHYPNQAPQFILYKGAKSANSVNEIPDSRYQSTTSGTSTELVIQHLTLSDTALYYCALGDHSDTKSCRVVLG
uniref:Ig-like domain-containing protein n=1 Tax=Esox lucius TaxID=8010 RepID=A0AAY5L7S2_ESOLU